MNHVDDEIAAAQRLLQDALGTDLPPAREGAVVFNIGNAGNVGTTQVISNQTQYVGSGHTGEKDRNGEPGT